MTVTGLFCAALCTMALGTAPAQLQVRGDTVTMFGAQVGAYIDDTTPDQCQVVQVALQRWPLVIAGMAPGGRLACPGAIMAREWYPYGCGRYWGPIPAARAYILQGAFKWPGCRQATPKQRTLELRAAMRHHPELILWY